ncbi:MAG TPA: isoprenyl transferase [Paludibacteraceae bacterium]|nr:isoprenyl transferase [Paludibacteraceae bacterium]HPT43891.1 isoprenyl transferase [Paludibacteraceae bacterium]
MSFKEQLDLINLPQHVAIIMDGNGRWAKERGYDRIYGHQHGVSSVRECTEAAAEIGLKYLTLYAFSTENWNRDRKEVEALMELLIDTIERETPTLDKNNISLKAIGDLSRLPLGAYKKLMRCIEHTKTNTGLCLVLALSYSSRWEICNALRQISQEVKDGKLSTDEISDELISSHLTTKEIPDPDLMIRTSGEIRISNFLLWQLAYTELYFTSTHWPDFRKENFFEAIVEFQRRERRFGK